MLLEQLRTAGHGMIIFHDKTFRGLRTMSLKDIWLTAFEQETVVMRAMRAA